MFAWLLGIEKSFTKSFLYVTFLASGLTIFGSLCYLFLVGTPLKLQKYMN